MAKPVVRVASAQIKHSEVSGAVTVGEESARRLSKQLGREVKAGEQFELGLLAVYDRKTWKRLWGSFRIKPHLFN